MEQIDQKQKWQKGLIFVENSDIMPSTLSFLGKEIEK